MIMCRLRLKLGKKLILRFPNRLNRNIPNSAQLLRPISYAHKRGLLVGHHVHMPFREFGVPNAVITVTAVKPLSQQRADKIHHLPNSEKPIIGVYIHQTNDVRTYAFKDNQGRISTIHATPVHPFYVKNLHTYVPISKVTDTMQLTGKDNEVIHLVCRNEKHQHCGAPYQKRKITIVYNIEVYQKHFYRVGDSAIKVHNPVGVGCNVPAKGYYELNLDNIVHPKFNPKRGGVLDDASKYSFHAETGENLSPELKRTILGWSETEMIDSGSGAPQVYRNLAEDAKELAGEINTKVRLNQVDNNYLFSYVKRDDKIIGVGVFRYSQGSNTVSVNATFSDPLNLISEKRISGFGAKLKYTGLTKIRNLYGNLPVKSIAMSIPSEVINSKLGFVLE